MQLKQAPADRPVRAATQRHTPRLRHTKLGTEPVMDRRPPCSAAINQRAIDIEKDDLHARHSSRPAVVPGTGSS